MTDQFEAVEVRMTPDEQDRRLMETTERMRKERLAVEQENAQLKSLINQYSTAIEQLESELSAISANAADRAYLKDILRQLAERSTSVAASL